MKILFLLVVNILMVSCQTTNHVVRIDPQKKKAIVQSQSDLGSAINALHKEGSLDKVKSTLMNLKTKSIKKRNRILLNISQIDLAEGHLDKAEKACRQVLKLDLKNQAARLVLAQIYYRRGYHEMAEIIVNGLGSWSKKDSRVLNLKALIALKKKQPSEAMYLFKESLKHNSSHIATRMNLGSLYIHYRLLSAAAIQYERVLKIMPENIDAKLHLAVIYASRRDFDKARTLYREVQDVHPSNALASYNLAMLEERQGNFAESIENIKKYLESDYAKYTDSQEVLAVVQRLRTKSEMTGNKINDDGIEILTEKNNAKPIKIERHVELEGESTKSDVTRSSNHSTEESSVDTDPEAKKDSEEIEDLEKVLMQ